MAFRYAMPGSKKSSISGFYSRTPDERLSIVANFAGLSDDDRLALRCGLDVQNADKLVENAIGSFSLPIGIATNFRINGKDYIIPMVVEEPSVIAAASAGAKATENIKAADYGPYVTGQIQIISPNRDAEKHVKSGISLIKDEAAKHLSRHMSVMDVFCARLHRDMLKVEIIMSTGKAMGANAVNTACEGVAPLIEKMTGGRALLRILSNAPPQSGYAMARFDADGEVAKDIVKAYRFAQMDANRAVTHNKGIMNGVTATGLATGQDTRAIEAAAHMHAVHRNVMEPNRSYGPLSKWEVREDGLWGTLSIPLRVGTIGGLTKRHAAAAACHKILGAPSSEDLAGIMASVGLCSNFSALRALATDGIQKGHMKLHRKRL